MQAHPSAVHVLALIADPSNPCAWWRVLAPFNALMRAGYPAHYLEAGDPQAFRAAMSHQAVILPRWYWKSILVPGQAVTQDYRDGERLIAAMHANGRLVFGEYDDDFFTARGEQKDAEALGLTGLNEGSPQEMVASLRLLDGVTVTTEAIRTSIETHLPDYPIEVVPNAIDLDYWQAARSGWKRNARTRGKVTIGWAGGNRHDTDLEILAEAWRRIALEFPEVLFVVMGHQSPVLTKAVPPERLVPIQWLPLTPTESTPAYPVGLAEIDIGCCSVFANRFNRAKTPIKAWEMAASGAAVVGTPWLYGEVIDHDENGMLAETADQWVAALRKLVRSRSRRKRLHAAMMADIQARWSLAANLARWPRAWVNLSHAAQSNLRRSVIMAGVR